MKKLYISHYVEKTGVLGPGVRSALWVNGCCFDCEGCIAQEMNSREPVEEDPERLARIFAGNTEAEGITISGGEPFLQAAALTEMVDCIRSERDYGVIVYTGFTMEELRAGNVEGAEEFLKRIDLLIDGRYEKELDDGLPYRGSSNQRFHLLTDRYKNEFEHYYRGSDKRNIEINFTNDMVYLVGVPSEHGMEVWRDLKKKAGLLQTWNSQSEETTTSN